MATPTDYGNQQEPFAGIPYGIATGKYISTRNCADEQIDWGIPVFTYEGDDINGYNVKQDISTITLDADFVVDNTITTTITIDGEAQTPVATPWNSDHDTTMDDHEADLEAAITDLEVTLTDGTNNRQFTLFLKGKNIEVASVITGGASQANITIAYTNGQVFEGVAQFTQKGNGTVGYYEQYDAMNVQERRCIWVETDDAVNSGEDAYVIWAYGADQGKFTNTETDNYETGCKFRSTRNDAGVALLEVNGIHTDATP